MCAVSRMHDYMSTNVPLDAWTRPLLTEYQEIIRLIHTLDEKLSQPDCEDTAKAAWMKEVEARLKVLEAT